MDIEKLEQKIVQLEEAAVQLRANSEKKCNEKNVRMVKMAEQKTANAEKNLGKMTSEVEEAISQMASYLATLAPKNCTYRQVIDFYMNQTLDNPLCKKIMTRLESIIFRFSTVNEPKCRFPGDSVTGFVNLNKIQCMGVQNRYPIRINPKNSKKHENKFVPRYNQN